MAKIDFRVENYGFTDCFERETELTKEQVEWFHNVCEDAKKAIGLNIKIHCCDHQKIKGHENALGIFWTREKGEAVSVENSFITIDTYTIYECYEHLFNDMHVFDYTELEEIIAHEMAHFLQFRHCKRHTRITKEFYDKIKEYQKNKEEGKDLEKMEKNYDDMLVKELREASRLRGLTLQENGHKFTKKELVERLKELDKAEEIEETAAEEKEEVQTQEEEKKVEKVEKEQKEVCEKPSLSVNEAYEREKRRIWSREGTAEDIEDMSKSKEIYKQGIIKARNLLEIIDKYQNRKKQIVYDRMIIGDIVLFVHYVISSIGEQPYKTLRVAEIVALDRQNEKILVKTIYGAIIEITYDDMVYTRSKDTSFPRDIRDYLKLKKSFQKKRYEENKAASSEKIDTFSNEDEDEDW